MSVIFGIKGRPRRLATILAQCAACGEPTAQDLCSMRNFFRLFFVPLVPLPSTFRTTCARCGTSTTVSTEQADRLLARAPRVDEPAEVDVRTAATVAA